MKKANIVADHKHVLIVSLKLFVTWTLYHIETMVMLAGRRKIQGEIRQRQFDQRFQSVTNSPGKGLHLKR